MTETSPVARIVVSLALLTLVAAACTTTPGPDSAGRDDGHAHGTLLHAERIGAPAGARAWRVRYLSQRTDGSAAPVTGVVIAPRGPAPRGGFPVVTWGHGLVGS